MHEAKIGAKVKYLPPIGDNYIIWEKAKKVWLL
jgi:hypothetical protein